MNRRERPYRRTLPSGAIKWVARYTRPDGTRAYAKPAWNGRSATFDLRREAQRAIDEAYELPTHRDTLGGYAASWPRRHPRSERTNETNAGRLRAVLDVKLEGIPLSDWNFDELRRRQVNDLVDVMLRDHGRAISGVRGILGVLSAMTENAIDDEVASANPFKGIRLRESDPRIAKATKPMRVWTFDEMRAFAACGRPEVRGATAKPRDTRRKRPGPKRFYSTDDYEPMLLTFALTGLRLGEVLALERRDLADDHIALRESGDAEHGTTSSTSTKNHTRFVPIPPSLAAALDRMPSRIDTRLLFPTPSGGLWSKRNFYRDVWEAARRASGMEATPHQFRHSYVSHLRAAGIDDADLAKVAGHRVETMLSRYTHALERSHDEIRSVIG